uniref:Exostosin GT47 domain-containing protein n=1 Tax=Chelydra serpentina TaxID=8475 RepID=A0A8C3SB48_CHESE
MQTRKKYIFITFFASWLLLFFFGGDQIRRLAFLSRKKAAVLKNWPRWTDRSFLKSFADPEELQSDGGLHKQSAKARRASRMNIYKHSRCRMETCFDFSRCEKHGFKVFVYPVEREDPVSESYLKIITSIEESRYYTSNPEEACLFILNIDTLDRDHLSIQYVHDINDKIQGFPLWNYGRNHLVFNLYSGTWPNYTEDLGFDIGQAILAKASFYVENFRPGFDISIPLFSKEHPQKGGERGWLYQNSVPPKKKYMLAFKGKRYLTGIGSDTRNATRSCSWTDGRGKQESSPGWETGPGVGTRLNGWGLMRALVCCFSSIQAACIPVLLSNGWELPFSDAIDWSKSAIVGDERLLLQVTQRPGACQSPILAFQQQTQFLWEAYFSSVEKIVQTTLEIIKDRIFHRESRPKFLWNTLPGGLLALPEYSTHLGDFPFYHLQHGSSPSGKFTAFIRAVSPVVSLSQPILKLIQAVSRSQHCAQILVLWSCEKPPPPRGRWPQTAVPLTVIHGRRKVSDRFFPYSAIGTDAVLSLDEHTSLSTSEVRRGGRGGGRWDAATQIRTPHGRAGCQGGFTSCPRISHWDNGGDPTGHCFYFPLGPGLMPPPLQRITAVATRLPKGVHCSGWDRSESWGVPGSPSPAVSSGNPRFSQRQDCLNQFAAWFGYMPLVHSQLRLDPVLFKDQVSVLRKKYRHLEKP